jgi:RNA 3'-terminal phosphate cyclase (ATP)
MGEGGGQILRSSLTLSLYLNKAFRIVNIRARRKRPGLQPQHLVAVEAAAAIGRADVRGAEPGASEIVFEPRQVTPGDYRFDIGTAGSTSLVLQTLLPALLTAAAASRLTLLGGTHNPLAPPFEFLDCAYLPLVRRMGPRVTARLNRAGFYPVGGGSVTVEIEPAVRLQPLELVERGRLQGLSAHALLAHLPEHIAQRELQVLQKELHIEPARLHVDQLDSAMGKGNALILAIESEHCNEVISGIGRPGLRAETVAQRVASEARHYLDADVPVGLHLADQLLLLLALAGGGHYRTMEPDPHTLTNIDVVRAFTGIGILCDRVDKHRWSIAIPPSAE